MQNVQRFLDGQAFHGISYQSHLAGRNAGEAKSGKGTNYHFFGVSFSSISSPTSVVVSLSLPLWPRKVRVGANSPNLWPTMFSVTKIGTNFLPLCTARVWPTKSGITVERRD